MATPVNGETFLPALIVEYLEAQRAALGLPDALTLCAWPYLGELVRPQLSVEASSFKFDGHPATQTYEVTLLLDYGVGGDPDVRETAAQVQTRLEAQLAAENAILAKVRAALALRTGQTISFTSSVTSLFSWITSSRSIPAGEDGWVLEDFTISAGGGSINYVGDKRIRHRLTSYIARLMTNEFTV